MVISHKIAVVENFSNLHTLKARPASEFRTTYSFLDRGCVKAFVLPYFPKETNILPSNGGLWKDILGTEF